MSDKQLRVGGILYGYCGGFFGRDSYGEKRIEAIGADWVVVREEDGTPNCALFPSSDDWIVDDLIQFLEMESAADD